MLAALTGTGLSAAAGLNAFIPFLIVALVSRFTDLIHLPSDLAWIDSWWAIGIGTLLLVVEIVVDKVPALDSVNDAIQTAVRPTMGGVIFAATNAAENIEDSTWFQQNSWIGIILGVVVALVVHGTKAAARPVVNAGTVGAGGPVVSTLEDGTSLGLSLLAVFLPILAGIALVALAAVIVWLWLKVRAWRKRRAQGRGDGADTAYVT